jgi:hypothetical protein
MADNGDNYIMFDQRISLDPAEQSIISVSSYHNVNATPTITIHNTTGYPLSFMRIRRYEDWHWSVIDIAIPNDSARDISIMNPSPSNRYDVRFETRDGVFYSQFDLELKQDSTIKVVPKDRNPIITIQNDTGFNTVRIYIQHNESLGWVSRWLRIQYGDYAHFQIPDVNFPYHRYNIEIQRQIGVGYIHHDLYIPYDTELTFTKHDRDDSNRVVNIVNNTNSLIIEVFMRPHGTTAWGSNLVEWWQWLSPGMQVEVQTRNASETNRYDIRLVRAPGI